MIKYYTVGGAVRDEILGLKSKDIDFAVEAPSYEEMREDLIAKGVIIYQERPEYFAIRGGHPLLGGVDYTLCRKEGFYWDNRHPDSVTIGTILDDLSRRDFTVNAIAKDEDGNLLDPFNGKEDIQLKVLRCVGRSEDRFHEDPLRLLRAVRFSLVRGFRLDIDIQIALMDRDLIWGLKKISLERIYEELKKCYEFNTFETMKFFRGFTTLENMIFGEMGLGLTPRIP